MLKNIKNEKGFTLIELLAVIVILGVLMIIAIPMVTKYIQQSRQDAFVDTAKAYINSARYGLLNDDYYEINTAGQNTDTVCSLTSEEEYYVIFENIDVDRNNKKSSFGNNIDTGNSYVHVKVGSGQSANSTYSVCMDDGEYWTTGEKKESELTRSNIKRNTTGCSIPAGAKKCWHETD